MGCGGEKKGVQDQSRRMLIYGARSGTAGEEAGDEGASEGKLEIQSGGVERHSCC